MENSVQFWSRPGQASVEAPVWDAHVLILRLIHRLHPPRYQHQRENCRLRLIAYLRCRRNRFQTDGIGFPTDQYRSRRPASLTVESAAQIGHLSGFAASTVQTSTRLPGWKIGWTTPRDMTCVVAVAA